MRLSAADPEAQGVVWLRLWAMEMRRNQGVGVGGMEEAVERLTGPTVVENVPRQRYYSLAPGLLIVMQSK